MDPASPSPNASRSEGPQAHARWGAGPASAAESWSALFERGIADLREAAASRLNLLVLESKRALQLAVFMLGLAVFAALLAVSAWFALLAALVAWAVAAGFALPWVLLVVALLCVFGAWLAVTSIKGAAKKIHFDRTWRVLRGTTAPHATPPAHEFEERG